MGISGRIAAAFQHSALTTLLAIMGLLLGMSLGTYSVRVTPRIAFDTLTATRGD